VKMEEEFDELKTMMKKVLDDVATTRTSVSELTESLGASQQQIELLKATSKAPPPPPHPPPPPPPKLASPSLPSPQLKSQGTTSPSTFERRVDVPNPPPNPHTESRNQGNGAGILRMPPCFPSMVTSYSATLTFHTNPVDTGWLDQDDRNFIPHKHLPKLDLPKFQGDNPKIWKKKCETYCEVFSVPAHLQTRYATLNFTDKAALWLETIEAKGRIERWMDLCNIVFDRWDKDQHSLTMCQILNIKQTRTVAGYINKFDDLRHQLLLHDPSASDVFFVTRFIEGLKNDIRSVIALHRPVDMDTVSSLAMMQEEENENGKKKIIQSMNHPVGIHGKPMLLTRLQIL
jgi:hypothetical protein